MSRTRVFLIGSFLTMPIFLTMPGIHLNLIAASFIRGDADGDGSLAVTDAINTMTHLYLGFPPKLDCRDAADANDDGVVDITMRSTRCGSCSSVARPPRALTRTAARIPPEPLWGAKYFPCAPKISPW
ncbi:MAG: hypothetical protein HY717_02200 [Planctomycetes bacterium]|nr:hypothetical protein [Planctomycetota bacterium]